MRKNSKLAIILFLPAAIVLILLRFILLLTGIDFETGFFYDESVWLGVTCYILMALCFGGFILTGILDKKKKSHFFTRKLSSISKKQVMLLAVIYVICGITCFLKFVQSVGDGEILSGVCDFLCAAGYILIGFSAFSTGKIGTLSGYLALFFCIALLIQSGKLYMDHLIILQISDYLMQLIAYLLLILFWLAIGRVFSRNETKQTRIRALVMGFSAALVIIGRGLPPLLVTFFAPSDLTALMAGSAVEYIPPVAFFAHGLAAVSTLIVMYHSAGESE